MQTTTIEPVKELTAIKGQVSKLENAANSLAIATQEDYTVAIDLVAQLKDRGSKIKILKESITKPANEILRNARAMFSPVEAQHANAEAIIKTKLLQYKSKVDAEARAEEAKIAARVEKGTMRLDTAEKKLDTIERVDNTTRGKVGEVQVRKIKKVRIIDAAALPREYLVPDEVAIRRDALSGKIIPGVEVYEEEVIAARNI